MRQPRQLRIEGTGNICAGVAAEIVFELIKNEDNSAACSAAAPLNQGGQIIAIHRTCDSQILRETMRLGVREQRE